MQILVYSLAVKVGLSKVTHRTEMLTKIVVVKNPADFVGSVLGESEKKTSGILASTVGKV